MKLAPPCVICGKKNPFYEDVWVITPKGVACLKHSGVKEEFEKVYKDVGGEDGYLDLLLEIDKYSTEE